MTMIDDKKFNPFVLNQGSIGVELILTAVLWKQVPCKPLWCVIIMGVEVMQPQSYLKFLRLQFKIFMGDFSLEMKFSCCMAMLLESLKLAVPVSIYFEKINRLIFLSKILFEIWSML